LFQLLQLNDENLNLKLRLEDAELSLKTLQEENLADGFTLEIMKKSQEDYGKKLLYC